MGSGQNYETYLIGGRNIFPITRAMSIQACRPNDFRSAYVIAKKIMEGLKFGKNISLEYSKIKITITSWIA